ncbi:MAG: glycosyltransferase family 1 protein [Actinomycetota bacterium]
MPDTLALRVALTMDASWTPVPGGTAVAAVQLARRLVDDPTVEPIGVAGAHRTEAPEELRPPMHVAHHRLPRPLLADAWHHLGRPRVERATGPVDVVHATSVITPATRAPLVVTVHDLLFLHEPDWFTGRGVRVMRAGLDAIRRRADLVLCSSRATAADVAAAGIEEDRLRVVPLGVDVSPVAAERVEDVRRRHDLERPYVLWNGTFEPRKNLRGLLEAIARWDVDGVDLALVGPSGWREAYPPELADRIDPDRTRVVTTGFVPRAELEALHAGAVVTCLPSLAEGFGFPVLEAFAQGTPVVTSTGTSTEELVGDAGIAVEPTDPDALAEALRSIVTDDGLRSRLASAAPAQAARYTWDRTAQLTVEAYREVAR